MEEQNYFRFQGVDRRLNGRMEVELKHRLDEGRRVAKASSNDM